MQPSHANGGRDGSLIQKTSPAQKAHQDCHVANLAITARMIKERSHMQVSSSTASTAAYAGSGSGEEVGTKKRQLSKTQQAVQAQLAHNKQQSQVYADKLAKVSGTKTSSTDATSGTATTAAATAAAASSKTASTASTTSTSTAKSSDGTASTTTTETTSTKKQSAYEKQKAYNQSMSKLHAAMLAKVSSSDSTTSTSTTSATSTQSASAAAVRAATAKYMENDGSDTKTSTTLIRA